MPVGTETKNGRQESGKANGDEESSNSEDESSYCESACGSMLCTPLCCGTYMYVHCHVSVTLDVWIWGHRIDLCPMQMMKMTQNEEKETV